jgi:DNA-directed RNA polymerase specialized sigma24 family protein
MEESCFAEPEPTLAELYALAVPWLRRYVQHHFPRACGSICEDAVQDAFLVAVEHPERFTAAWTEGGLSRVDGLCRTIAWRAARGRLARSCNRREIGGDALLIAGLRQAPGQELVAEARLHLDRIIDQAARRHAPTNPAGLRLALVDRMRSGESDTAVAERHGIRREYINRSRREIERALWGAA